MDEYTSGTVAVAVPHDGVDSALRFAAREGLVRGCRVVVSGPSELLPDTAALVEVLAGPGVPVDARAQPAPDVESFLAACPEATLAVVHRSSVLHLLHAASYGTVGAQALTDIACVPPTWVPLPDDTRPVVVAVDDAFHAERLLAAGLEQARLHGTRLCVVHAWDLPCRLGAEKEEAVARLWQTELESRPRRQLRGLSDGARCEVEVRHAVAADAVLEAAADAQLLVLGRNAAADHRCHLGRVARVAVRESACPVILLARPGPGSGQPDQPGALHDR